jgi:hypothetical protein
VHEIRALSLVHGLQVVPEGTVGDWAVHPAVLPHDPVSPVATAAASRDRPGLQQHVIVQRVPLGPRDIPAPDVLLEGVAGYAKMVGGTVSTLATAVSSVLVEVRGWPKGRGMCRGGGAGESQSGAGIGARGAYPRDDRRPASGSLVGQSRTLVDRTAGATP